LYQAVIENDSYNKLYGVWTCLGEMLILDIRENELAQTSKSKI
jgi:hypothetical protein